MKVAIVEDEQRLARVLQHEFESQQHTVDVFLDASSARERLESSGKLYDLIILDLMLPDGDGSEVCRILRSSGVETPILILTARDSTEDKVELFENGADDFLVKPFDLEELFARSKSLHRRSTVAFFVEEEYKIGNVRIVPRTYEVFRNNKRIRLTRREFEIILYLVRNRGRIISREELFIKVWNASKSPTTNTVDVHMRNLRSKLDDPFSTKILETIYGVGYRIA